MDRILYLFSRKFLEDIGLRLHGPASFRFIIQPLMAIILGIRDGLMDAKAGRPPYIYDIVRHPANRARSVREGWKSLGIPIIIAIVLDAIVQYLMFGTVYVIAAVIVGTLLMGIPYALARGITNRIATRRKHQRDSETHKGRRAA